MVKYWQNRSAYQYYTAVHRLLIHYSPGEMLLDVGCADTPIVLCGDFKRRVTVDVNPRPALEGVEAYVCSWMNVEFSRASVALCLQTLEHIDDDGIGPFAEKLRRAADIVIVSVPYKWPAGRCRWHRQDPIDLPKLDRIMGAEPIGGEAIIWDGGLRRLVCVYQGLC